MADLSGNVGHGSGSSGVRFSSASVRPGGSSPNPVVPTANSENREGQVRYLRAGLITAACVLLPSTALAAVTTAPNGQRLSLMLRHGIKGGGGGGSKNGAVLIAHGGPVLKSEAPYVIYWTGGQAVSSSFATSESVLNTYLTDVAAASAAGSTTNVYSVLAQQYGAPYSQTFNANGAGKAKPQVVLATDAYPSTGCSTATGMTACVSDSSIQAELTKLITAGTLPPTGAIGTGTNPVFFVVTPPNVNVCTSTSQCVNNSFCAYHSYFVNNKQDVLYASVPFSVFATSTKGCQTDQYSSYNTPVGPSGDEAYNIADDLSHELSETITDPLINAYYSRGGYEVGDLCEAYGATADTSKGLSPLAYAPAFASGVNGGIYDQMINGDPYYNQTEYNNALGQCSAGVTALTGTPF